MSSKNFDKVLNVLNKYDLLGITRYSDNYYLEAANIADKVEILNEQQLAEHIYNVFQYWFHENIIPDKNNKVYLDIAEEIKKNINDNKNRKE